MSVMDELRALDPRDPGRWPFAMRAAAVAICFVVVAIGLIYVFVWQDRMPDLQQREDQEQQLRKRIPYQAFQGRQPRRLQAAAHRYRKILRRAAAAAAEQDRGAESAGGHIADRTGGRAGREAVSARAGNQEGLLRRAADPYPAHRQLPRVRRVRQRHRGAAAYRHAARHPDHAGSARKSARPTISCSSISRPRPIATWTTTK